MFWVDDFFVEFAVFAGVYTRAAYLADPDVIGDPGEYARVQASDCQFVLVTIKAVVGPKAPYSPYRLVANLAGANNDFEEGKITLKEAIEKAKAAITYDKKWCVVAD